METAAAAPLSQVQTLLRIYTTSYESRSAIQTENDFNPNVMESQAVL
jgi:hypothetical protein